MKLAKTLLGLFVFLALSGCAPEEVVTPTLTSAPPLAEVLATQLAITSTLEPTAIPSYTPEPANTEAPPTATATIVTSTEVPDEQTQEAPTPTSAATETVTLRVLPQSISLRQGPGTIYRVIGFLFVNDEARVLARDNMGAWYNVRTNDNLSGWVAASVTEVLNTNTSMASIEIAATIPVPPTLTPSATPTNTPVPTPVPPQGGGGGSKPPSKPEPTAYPGPEPTSAPPPASPVPTRNPYP